MIDDAMLKRLVAQTSNADGYCSQLLLAQTIWKLAQNEERHRCIVDCHAVYSSLPLNNPLRMFSTLMAIIRTPGVYHDPT